MRTVDEIIADIQEAFDQAEGNQIFELYLSVDDYRVILDQLIKSKLKVTK